STASPVATHSSSRTSSISSAGTKSSGANRAPSPRSSPAVRVRSPTPSPNDSPSFPNRRRTRSPSPRSSATVSTPLASPPPAATRAATRKHAPPGEIAQLAYRTGIAHYRNSDPVPSRTYLERAEMAYRAASDPSGVARALTDRTRAELTAGRFGTRVALEPLETALAALSDPGLQARPLAQM